MTPDQAEQLLAVLESISESLRMIANAVDTAAYAAALDEEG